jgi:hypothetical protein
MPQTACRLVKRSPVIKLNRRTCLFQRRRVTNWGNSQMSRLVAAMIVLGIFCTALSQPTLAQSGTKPAEKPIDKGPFTPAATGAYQGGAVILQGAPGDPAPMPKPTPPGPVPKNSVPLK